MGAGLRGTHEVRPLHFRSAAVGAEGTAQGLSRGSRAAAPCPVGVPRTRSVSPDAIMGIALPTFTPWGDGPEFCPLKKTGAELGCRFMKGLPWRSSAVGSYPALVTSPSPNSASMLATVTVPGLGPLSWHSPGLGYCLQTSQRLACGRWLWEALAAEPVLTGGGRTHRSEPAWGGCSVLPSGSRRELRGRQRAGCLAEARWVIREVIASDGRGR